MRYSIVFFAFAAFSSASVESGLRLDSHWNDVSLLVGYRPLDAGGRWQFFNNIISHINLPGDIDSRHAEIFFEDNNDDDKQHRTSHIGYGPTGVHIDTSKVPYNKRDKKQYDDARMREAIEKVKKRPEWEGGRYGFVTHNCQDFVSAVIKEYNNIK